MVSLMAELHFWTMKEDIFIKDSDLGCFKFYDKGDTDPEEQYVDAKQEYARARDTVWTPSNKRPEKLRDTLKEFEEILGEQRCIVSRWLNPGLLQLLFHTGIVISLHIAVQTCQLYRVVIDRYLVGKLASEHVTNAIVENNFILVAYSELKMTYVSFSKSLLTPEGVRKLSSLEPKIVTFDIVGLPGRRLQRRLSINSSKDWVMIWWSPGDGEVWPWMPSTSNRDRSNVVVYALNGPNVELLTYGRVERVPVLADFSRYHPNQVLTVEEDTSRGGGVTVDICVYDIARGKFERVSMVSISLQDHVIACQWNSSEDKLILLCNDASLVLYDANRQTTHFSRIPFVGVSIAWHPSGGLVFLAGKHGQLQCLDVALSTVQLQLVGENSTPTRTLNLDPYFRHHTAVQDFRWQAYSVATPNGIAGPTAACASLLFDGGPLAIFKLSLGLLAHGQAVCMLLSLDWGRLAEQCFFCLTKIVNYLLRKPLDDNREAQLEAALGSFYGSAQPIPDAVVMEYGEQVGHLARRFFHHLLRHEKFEKAFLLAVDLGCRDLFLDLHHIAKRRGENALMEVALRRANALRSDQVLSDCESADIDSSSELTDDYCSSDDGLREATAPVSPYQPRFAAKSTINPRPQNASPSAPLLHTTRPLQANPRHTPTNMQPSYKWPPPQDRPVQERPPEDVLIDLGNDSETSRHPISARSRSLPPLPSVQPLVPQAVPVTPSQSVIRPIPKMSENQLRETPQSVNREECDSADGAVGGSNTVSRQWSRQNEEGKGIQCIHFGVV
ncbi:WD repeat-containing and planar cell polarity effector protein fritz homolog isoform X2 [Ornithodoros turicata]|uniref:WD repeat-containing and planar cell polarity effector protein fritz homolog isoform X2 n=1 Tax=Ornithodoros turicata TaxID=34597 RepID=UPI00313948BC